VQHRQQDVNRGTASSSNVVKLDARPVDVGEIAGCGREVAHSRWRRSNRRSRDFLVDGCNALIEAARGRPFDPKSDFGKAEDAQEKAVPIHLIEPATTSSSG
jgi:hypothetical protein